jgi:hypothetical protein
VSKNIGADIVVMATNLRELRDRIDGRRFPDTVECLGRVFDALMQARVHYEKEVVNKVLA